MISMWEMGQDTGRLNFHIYQKWPWS